VRRVPELDAVRGLAAIVVMIYHLRPQAFALTGIRVDPFLILSGYLLTSIVLEKATLPGFLPTFHIRRSLRILPTYYLTLLFITVVNPVLPKPFPMAALPYYLTFTQNLPRYWGATPPPFNWYFLHTWSLALEQQWYLLWPLVVVFVGRSRVIPVALVLTGISVVARAMGVHWWLLLARADGLALGSALAVMMSDLVREPARLPQQRRVLATTVAVSLGLIVSSLWLSKSWNFEDEMTPVLSLTILGVNLFFFGVIGVVASATGHPALRILRDGRLAYLGRISYGLYLYHPLVYIAIYVAAQRLRLGEPLWLEPIKLAAVIAAASFSWHWIEQPVMGWRSRFAYMPRTPREVPSVIEWGEHPGPVFETGAGVRWPAKTRWASLRWLPRRPLGWRTRRPGFFESPPDTRE
jgi:peptidoglycan/LPS O-acetylase OafA/YrhL